MLLLHFHKPASDAGEPIEYLALVSDDGDIEAAKEKHGQPGYEVSSYDLTEEFEWPAGLPLDRRLIPVRRWELLPRSDLVGL